MSDTEPTCADCIAERKRPIRCRGTRWLNLYQPEFSCIEHLDFDPEWEALEAIKHLDFETPGGARD